MFGCSGSLLLRMASPGVWASCGSFSYCGAWAPEQGLRLWLTGCLVAPKHVRPSWTRDWTFGPCIGRWILNPWTTTEVPVMYIFTQENNLKLHLNPCNLLCLLLILILTLNSSVSYSDFCCPVSSSAKWAITFLPLPLTLYDYQIAVIYFKV